MEVSGVLLPEQRYAHPAIITSPDTLLWAAASDLGWIQSGRHGIRDLQQHCLPSSSLVPFQGTDWEFDELRLFCNFFTLFDMGSHMFAFLAKTSMAGAISSTVCQILPCPWQVISCICSWSNHGGFARVVSGVLWPCGTALWAMQIPVGFCYPYWWHCFHIVCHSLHMISMSCTISMVYQQCFLLKVMSCNKKAKEIAKQIDDMRKGGHGSYYGESVEVLAALQLQHSWMVLMEAVANNSQTCQICHVQLLL